MALGEDEDRQKPMASGMPRDLSRLSIEELQGYVTSLQQEIARAEAAIRERRAVRDAAEALFRSRTER
jgi:uncharacterized small protein (DUF1192 family)